MHEYFKQLIRFNHLVNGILEPHLVSSFMFGLKEGIKSEVRLQKPSIVMKAYRLACAKEGVCLAHML